jgi:hypothetical protein
MRWILRAVTVVASFLVALEIALRIYNPFPFRVRGDRIVVMELYNDTTRRISAAARVRLIDLAREMPKDPRYFSDWIHFTNDGAVMVGDLVFQGLRAAL